MWEKGQTESDVYYEGLWEWAFSGKLIYIYSINNFPVYFDDFS